MAAMATILIFKMAAVGFWALLKGLHHYYTLHRLSVQIEVPSRGSISKKKVGLPI